MARPERPVDPDDGPLARFAFDLRELRQAGGGIGYRELAKRAHFSRTALSHAASGTELPSLAVTLAYVATCGGDVTAWEARWHELASQLRPNQAPAALPPPPRGGSRSRSGRRWLLWLAAPTVVSFGLIVVWQMAGSANHPARPRAAADPAASAAKPAQAVKPRPLVPGDDDKFIADITIPDGTMVRVNQPFTKTWEIQNTGSVPWRNRYLQRQGLSQGAGLCTSTDRVRVADTLPGQHVQISVILRPPKAPGSCQVYWKLVDIGGREFFPSKQGLYVTVNVAE